MQVWGTVRIGSWFVLLGMVIGLAVAWPLYWALHTHGIDTSQVTEASMSISGVAFRACRTIPSMRRSCSTVISSRNDRRKSA